MPTERVAGIWDFLGQGMGNVAAVMKDKRDRSDMKEREEAQRIQNLVAQGLMDSATANNLPISKKLGLQFQTTPQEMARRLMGTPATVMPEFDVSKYVSTGPGAALSGLTGQVSKMPAGTPDERAFAGLPSAGALSGDALTNTINTAKTRYFGTATPGQAASALNLPTASEVESKQRKDLDPLITSAAERHVDTVLNAAGIDLMDAPSLRRNATALANKAYEDYLAEASASGNMTSLTPEKKAYAKTFFQKAISDAVKTATDASLKLQMAREGRAGQNDKSIQLYNALTATADDFDRQAKELRGSPMGMVMSVTPADKLAAQPHLQGLANQVRGFEEQARTYRKNALKAIAGKLDVNALDMSGGAPPPAAAPSGSQPNFSNEEFNQAVSMMRKIAPDQQAAVLEQRRGLLSPSDYEKLKKALGL